MSGFANNDPSAPARIEIVMLLQQIDLFRFCSAREILRIAEIARTETFEEGALIYEANCEPLAIYCVVDGLATVEEAHGGSLEVRAGEPFGVREVLSGRLRRGSARAVSRTTALVLEADDFFDLLSNNIEIVKGLFRRILQDRRWRSGEEEDDSDLRATPAVIPDEAMGNL